jgi:NAD(P)H-nitrite reductase large subunit
MYVIIGQGAAGTAAAKLLRQLDPATAVNVITAEEDYYYSRIDLPDVIAGKIDPAAAALQAADQFAAAGITCRMGTTVTSLLPAENRVALASGEKLGYSKLLLATGSSPLLPPVSGIDARGVYSLWTLQQARAIAAAAADARQAVVIGAGLIGLKTALALAARGLKVTVVEKLPQLMPRQLDKAAAEIIGSRLAAKGVEVLLGAEVTAIPTANGAVTGVKTDAATIDCQLVVAALGVKPNSGLATAAGITTRRGIVVDERQQTSVPGIYAAGDVAETTDELSGSPVIPAIWPVAVEQGLTAARNMAGRQAAFPGSVAMNAVEVAGIPLVSIGDVAGGPEDTILVVQRGDSYRKVVLRGKLARGVLCLGDIRQAGVLGNLVVRRKELEPADAVAAGFSYADLIRA